MAYYFLDTSSLVKRYVDEPGRQAVLAVHDPERGHYLYLSDAAGPELVAALTRRARGQGVGETDLEPTLTAFRSHWRHQYRRLRLVPAVIERAMTLAEHHGLRGYDAIHLAAALALADTILSHDLPPLVFVSADKEQLDAAAVEGLAVLATSE